jgi:hypothetical protein
VLALKLALLTNDGLPIETLIANLDHIESLAMYVKDPSAAERLAAGNSASSRGKRGRTSSDDSPETLAAAPKHDDGVGSYKKTSRSGTYGSPSPAESVMQSTSVKRRKLTSARVALETLSPMQKNAARNKRQSDEQVHRRKRQ